MLTDEQKMQKELLVTMYQEYVTRCRHHETLRAAISNSLIAIDSIIGGFITLDKNINRYDIPLILLLIFLGFFGIIFTLSHSERYLQYSECSRQYRNQLDLLANGLIAEGKKAASKLVDAKFKFPRYLRHHYLWSAIHLLVMGIGILLLVLALFSPYLAPAATT